MSLSVVPASGLWQWLRAPNRVRTGDRHYDCRFITQGTADRRVEIPCALRSLHLTMPVSVFMGNGVLEIIHDGHTGVAETEQLIKMSMVWLRLARHQLTAADNQIATGSYRWDVLGCALSHLAGLVFLLVIGTTLLVFFMLPSEESNRPWEIALRVVTPVAIPLWLGWMVWRWRTRFNPGGRFKEIVVAVLALAIVLLMSGSWVLAWNALVGEQREVLVVGTVIDKSSHRGRRGASHSVTLRDIEEQRPVEMLTDQPTYERLRLGDPVGFTLTRGSLGIYYRVRWR